MGWRAATTSCDSRASRPALKCQQTLTKYRWGKPLIFFKTVSVCQSSTRSHCAVAASNLSAGSFCSHGQSTDVPGDAHGHRQDRPGWQGQIQPGVWVLRHIAVLPQSDNSITETG